MWSQWKKKEEELKKQVPKKDTRPESKEREQTKRAVVEAIKEDKGKQKVGPSFKLASDIETSTDLRNVL